MILSTTPSLVIPLNGLFIGEPVKHVRGYMTSISTRVPVSKAFLSVYGFEGDAQADTAHHGGPDRAVHHYPLENYHFYAEQGYLRDSKASAPGFGENISTEGLQETDLCIGDIWRLGQALVQVTMPRSPCFKMNHQFSNPQLSRISQESLRTGWLYRVLEQGMVHEDASLTLIDRISDVTVSEAMSIYFSRNLRGPALERLFQCSGLSQRWRSVLGKRLAAGRVENWDSRLYGADA